MKRALQARRNYWFSELAPMTNNRQALKTILAFINHLLWVAANRYKYIDRLANGRTSIRRRFIDITKKQIAVYTATTGMSKYIEKYWRGSNEKMFWGGHDRAWHGRTKLLEIQRLLEGWGLFEVDSPGFQPGQRRPTKYLNIKIAELLILAEVLESLLCDTGYREGITKKSSNLSTLPKHCGYTLVKMFNTLFFGIAEWRRQSEDDLILPIWELSMEEEAEWEYEFGWELNF